MWVSFWSTTEDGKNEEEDVNDVDVKNQGSKHILLRMQLILSSSHDQLSIKSQELSYSIKYFMK